MASIRKRGNRWFAQVRRKGFAPLYKSFSSKTEAQAWAREQESKVDRNEAPVDLRGLRRLTLGDLVSRYMADITPRKRSSYTERLRLTKMLRHQICSLRLAALEPSHLASYRDERLTQVKPGTIRRELSLFHHILDTAEREWGIRLGRNPVSLITQPKLNNARDRRLREGELERLRKAMRSSRNPLVEPIVLLAIETALRRQEILGLEWRHIDSSSRTAHIPWSKTGKPRTIPLTAKALVILDALRRNANSERVFPISTNAFKLAWQRARARADIGDLRFHDLRHEAISRFCELGLSIPEVAVISGHRDPRMLFRYAHLRPCDLAAKLAKLISAEPLDMKAAA